MCHFHVGATPFYTRNLSICGVSVNGDPGASLLQIPCRLYFLFFGIHYSMVAPVLMFLFSEGQAWPFCRSQKLVGSSRHGIWTIHCLFQAPAGSPGHCQGLDTLRTLLKSFPVVGSQKWLPLRPANRQINVVGHFLFLTVFALSSWGKSLLSWWGS